MHPVREKMESAIKLLIVPKLRELGFKGSMPHFRRVTETKADLLTFQFNSSGGSFVVELAVCTNADIENHWRADLTFKNVTAHDINSRQRLGSKAQGSDHWFVYGKKNYEAGHEKIETDVFYQNIATEVTSLLNSQAGQIWLSLTHHSSGTG
jgi:hypothetical protein